MSESLFGKDSQERHLAIANLAKYRLCETTRSQALRGTRRYYTILNLILFRTVCNAIARLQAAFKSQQLLLASRSPAP